MCASTCSGQIRAVVLALSAVSYPWPLPAASVAGYEVTRTQTVQNAPGDSVGRKTTDIEVRVGNTPDTDGNTSRMVLTLGGFVKKCPDANGIVTGNIEYRMTLDEVDTDKVPTERRHFEKGFSGELKGHVEPDGLVKNIDLNGTYRKNADTPPVRVEEHFTINAFGEPDRASMERAADLTDDLSTSIAMWFAGQNFPDAQKVWTTPNQCVELAFDPASNTRALLPGQSVEVRAHVRTLLDQSAVGLASIKADSLGGAQVTPREGTAPENGVLTFKYTAPQERRPPRGFNVAAKSRAGFATGEWRVTDALRLSFEHRIASRRDTGSARAGATLFEGTATFDVQLEPFPTVPGLFRGETDFTRQFAVGHITPRCSGQAAQEESWRVNAQMNPASGNVELRINVIDGNGEGYWDCTPGGRDDVFVDIGSELKYEEPLTLPARSGSRQQFTLRGVNSEETLTVTVN